jgi:hypothetical protein
VRSSYAPSWAGVVVASARSSTEARKRSLRDEAVLAGFERRIVEQLTGNDAPVTRSAALRAAQVA